MEEESPDILQPETVNKLNEPLNWRNCISLFMVVYYLSAMLNTIVWKGELHSGQNGGINMKDMAALPSISIDAINLF